MSTVLRVVLDEPLAPGMPSSGRSAVELTRALIAVAPSGSQVDVVTPALEQPVRELLESALPGMHRLLLSPLSRRGLELAWRHGVALAPGEGILHSPSVVAPLRAHDRSVDPSSQVSVTVDALPAWLDGSVEDHPTARSLAGWVRRAERHADAIVVPTHDLAGELGPTSGDRVRVIPPGIRTDLVVPEDAVERRRGLGLPDEYVLAPARKGEQGGVTTLLASAAHAGIRLVLIDAATDRGPDVDTAADPILRLPTLDGAERAAAIAGASAVVDPGRAVGTAPLVLEAMALGVPVVVGPAPALAEFTAGAAVAWDASDDPADAIRAVLEDESARRRLGILGRDRAHAFTWNDAAEKIWQLHADL